MNFSADGILAVSLYCNQTRHILDHAYYMNMALELAQKGWPAVMPNPMVGCVITRGDEVVATGYHQQFGGPHAEVNAIAALGQDIDPRDCVLYVTLEPCSHCGKTPPCADLIVSREFTKVVIACKDPNPLVSGAGIRKLLEAGVDVITGVLGQEAKFQNRRFFTFFGQQRPYIILKWALTADGFIAREPHPVRREDNIITREPALRLAHQLRAESMAVVVGKNTVLRDNPGLTTRLVKGANPLRIFIDRRLEVGKDFRIYDNAAPTVVLNDIREGQEGTVTYVKIPPGGDLVELIISKCYELKIQSLLVEGGSVLLSAFIAKDLWDEAMVFQNPDLRFGQGVKGPVFPLKNTFELVGEDKLYRHRRNETISAPGENETF